MKNHFIILLSLLVLCSCKQENTQKSKEKNFTSTETPQKETTENNLKKDSVSEKKADTLKQEKQIDNSQHYTQKDSVPVEIIGGTMFISKKDFNEYIDRHPELLGDEVHPPKITYYELSKETYGEAGGDQYFAFYAHFLKELYDYEAYEKEKKRLHEIFHELISFSSYLRGGGTFFGHEKARLIGFIEYEGYRLSKLKEKPKETDYKNQKSAFIDFLRKDIQEAEDYDGFGVEDLIASGDRDLDEMLKKYHKSVDKIEALITDSFYLERAKEFYSPYNTYIR